MRRLLAAVLAALAIVGCGPVGTAGSDGWRAIVAFTDTEAVSEDWNWFLEDIRGAVDATVNADIQVVQAGLDDRVVVIGPQEAPVARIDIGRYLAHGRGYLFMEDGRDIQYQPYGQSTDTLREASDYFGVRLGR